MAQRELVGSPHAAVLAALGARVSGGRIVGFERGWAKALMRSHTRAHYFVRDESRDKDSIALARALCGATAWLHWLYGEGNYEHCARCDAALLNVKR